MKIMSIDASTRSTGVAIFDDDQLLYYECLTETDKNVHERILNMSDKILAISLKYNPDKIIMEEVLPEDVGYKQSTFKALIYLQAVVVLYMDRLQNKEVEFIVNSEWRARCGIRTGRGIKRDTLKAADIKFVKDTFDLEVNDDIADAICIGYAYRHKPEIFEGFEFK